MTSPLWEHKGQIARKLQTTPHRLFCFDFDGTLTPIVSEPGRAHLSTAVRSLLRQLAGFGGIDVGIVSGRSLDDVRSRISLPEMIVAGNHGLEIDGPGFSFLEPEADRLRVPLQLLANNIEAHLRSIPGAKLENKGLTLSIHFRQVDPARHEEVRAVVERDLGALDQRFAMNPGLMVWEVRPRSAWNKGSAVNWIKERLGASQTTVLYVGDDRTDEDAFRALPDDVTVKVGAATPTAAAYFLAEPKEMEMLLEWLCGLFRPYS